jgi:hypothetical protein
MVGSDLRFAIAPPHRESSLLAAVGTTALPCARFFGCDRGDHHLGRGRHGMVSS